MLQTIFKKKLNNNQLANIFVNGVLDSIENGFDEVKSLMLEDPAFINTPPANKFSNGHFTMIVIVGNVSNLINYFDAQKTSELEDIIFEKFAEVFNMDLGTFKGYYKDYKSFISRVNHPSKNMLYGMSKALFFKYQLNQYQDDYFKKLSTPNPLFLKRMDEVMNLFVWDWENFQRKFKVGNS